MSATNITAPRFADVSCSNCGCSFGPGNEGFSHCEDHAHLRSLGRLTEIGAEWEKDSSLAKWFPFSALELEKANADAKRLRECLAKLLRQTNNIEALGEWEALDINPSMRRTTRAQVDAVIADCRAALQGRPT